MRFGAVDATRWADARHLLLPALNRAAEKSEDELVADLKDQLAQLWIGEDEIVRCAVVTCLSRTTGGLICEVWLMGGRERSRWLHFLENIEEAARLRGCASIEFTGRKGWARLLPAYRCKALVMERIL